MLALTDSQLQIVMDAAQPLPVDKRETFLWRVSARLQLQRRQFDDDDVATAVRAALVGLVQEVVS
jgi:hypothetical protein